MIKSGVDKTKLKELIHQDNGVLGKIEKNTHFLKVQKIRSWNVTKGKV